MAGEIGNGWYEFPWWNSRTAAYLSCHWRPLTLRPGTRSLLTLSPQKLVCGEVLVALSLTLGWQPRRYHPVCNSPSNLTLLVPLHTSSGAHRAKRYRHVLFIASTNTRKICAKLYVKQEQTNGTGQSDFYHTFIMSAKRRGSAFPGLYPLHLATISKQDCTDQPHPGLNRWQIHILVCSMKPATRSSRSLISKLHRFKQDHKRDLCFPELLGLNQQGTQTPVSQQTRAQSPCLQAKSSHHPGAQLCPEQGVVTPGSRSGCDMHQALWFVPEPLSSSATPED